MPSNTELQKFLKQRHVACFTISVLFLETEPRMIHDGLQLCRVAQAIWLTPIHVMRSALCERKNSDLEIFP